MSNNPSTHTEKLHPASREMLPDDPLSLHAVEVPGNADLMLRMLVEEYARIGWGLEALLRLFRDPFYVAAHGLWLHYGEDELHRRLTALLSRVGVLRVKTTVSSPPAEQLVQINLSSATKGADHG